MSALDDLDLQSLVGRPASEARSTVVAAGGGTRTVAPAGAVTADFQPGRITLIVSGGRVAELPVRG